MAIRLKINSTLKKQASARVAERHLKRHLFTIPENNHRNRLSCLVFTKSTVKIFEPRNRTFS
jgi:hypothetical protein